MEKYSIIIYISIGYIIGSLVIYAVHWLGKLLYRKSGNKRSELKNLVRENLPASFLPKNKKIRPIIIDDYRAIEIEKENERSREIPMK